MEEGESESEDEGVIVEGTVGDKIVAEKGDEMVKSVADPRLPTEKEIEKHNLTHLPYRNWCSACVAAKGKDLDHRKCVCVFVCVRTEGCQSSRPTTASRGTSSGTA